MVVIGIGDAGSNIVSCFGKGHKKIMLTSDKFPSTCKTVEDYENKCPAFKKELGFRNKECWAFVCGAEKEAAATLRILEKIKNKTTHVVCIVPDSLMITPEQQKRHKVVFNVLQQYARSGMLDSLYLVSNIELLAIAGEGPISSMYRNANVMLANIFETVEYFKTQKSVMGSISDTKDISRIKTFGVGTVEEIEEKMIFPLDNITEISYMYSICEDDLNQENDMLSNIKAKIAEDKENNMLSSFAIFSSEHNQSFFYSIKSTHHIQGEV